MQKKFKKIFRNIKIITIFVPQHKKMIVLKNLHTTTFNALHSDKAGFYCNTITSCINKPTVPPYYYARTMDSKVFADESKTIYHSILFLQFLKIHISNGQSLRVVNKRVRAFSKII